MKAKVSHFKWHSQNQLSHSGLSKLCVSFFWQTCAESRKLHLRKNCITYTNMWYVSVKQHLRKAGRSSTPDYTSYQMTKFNFDGIWMEKKKKPFITRSHTESFECEKDMSWCRTRASHSGSPCHGAIWRVGRFWADVPHKAARLPSDGLSETFLMFSLCAVTIKSNLSVPISNNTSFISRATMVIRVGRGGNSDGISSSIIVFFSFWFFLYFFI